MQGISRLKEAIERHKENKDINIRYKTPLTGKRPTTATVITPPANNHKSATRIPKTTSKESKMPVTHFAIPEKYSYQNGFGSYHE